ncbi:centromere protein j [Anaeramoeba flamelloides]|uniref:Centromere protein j n=1 Tax=Anaeramoeba flamelloides TaxID=1746091 RepID=A0AAV7ZCW3_9EUKA|nr:centromere protein j [Anaeramoeba flamelloides]
MDLTHLNCSDQDPNYLETPFLNGENCDELIYDPLFFGNYTISNSEGISSINQLKSKKQPQLLLKNQNKAQQQQQLKEKEKEKEKKQQQHNHNLYVKLDSNGQTTFYNPNEQKTFYDPNQQNIITKSQNKTKYQAKANPNKETTKLPKPEKRKEIPVSVRKKKIKKTIKVVKRMKNGHHHKNQLIKVKKKHGRALDEESLEIRQRLAAIEDPEAIKQLTQQEKRLRRLERNRLSAKRTRMRKKNEEKDSGGQISQLQNIIQQLQYQLVQQHNEIYRLNSVIEHYKSKEEEEEEKEQLRQKRQQQQQQQQQNEEIVQLQKKKYETNNQSIFTIGENNDTDDLENNLFGIQTETSINFSPRKRTREIKKQRNFTLVNNNKKAFFTTLFVFWIIVGLCFKIGTNFSMNRLTQPPSLSRIEKESVGKIPWNQKKANGNNESNDNNQDIFENKENINQRYRQHGDLDTQIKKNDHSYSDSDSYSYS